MTFPVLSAGTSAYNLQRSLRFRSSASAYLNRTPASAGNRTAWTMSMWVKRGALSTGGLFSTINSGAVNTTVGFNADAIDFLEYQSATVARLTTTAVYRDPSAWYHLVLVWDSSNGTSTDRVRIYVNGTRITALSTATYPSSGLTSTWNNNVNSSIGTYNNGSPPQLYFDGYMTEINFIDGQALTPSSFGSTNAVTGVWQPAKYTGTYGTNGFYLPFTNLTSTSTLGNDFSGNSNNWTTNNISLTSGVTYDSMTDVPTLTSATAANFAVLNRLSTTAGTYSNANLRYVGTSSWRRTNSTIAVNSGKWYWEVTLANAPFSPRASYTAYNAFGFGIATTFDSTTGATLTTDVISLSDNGYYKNFSGAFTDSGVGFASGDVLSIAVDLTANTFTFYRNNSSIVTGTISVTAGTTLTPVVLSYDGTYGVMDANFGQRPFAYTPPSGFVALNTFNLPSSTILDGGKYFNAALVTGSSSVDQVITVGFAPDFLWSKCRNDSVNHGLYDTVRGGNKYLSSNTTVAEVTTTSSIVTFNSNGATLQAGGSIINDAARIYVDWVWKANGAGVTNTAGSITSTVSANTTSGFSVVTYTGNGTGGATIGHGLGVAPSMVIVKRRNGVIDWPVYHVSIGNTSAIFLSGTFTPDTSTVYWNNTTPTSSVFTSGSGAGQNASGGTYVAYCFAPIAGFSAFGSYTGNGSTDGPFIYTGFRPRWIMCKSSTDSGGWTIMDTSRLGYNANNSTLYAEATTIEQGYLPVDILSNGFKIRVTSTGTSFNTSGQTYIYAAFAENPFKNALAR